MPIEDRGDGHLEPGGLGGKDTGGEILIPVSDIPSIWTRLRSWWKKEPPAQQPESWMEANARRNCEKCDDAIAKACGETENQRRMREQQEG
jgi:hypothetical protein